MAVSTSTSTSSPLPLLFLHRGTANPSPAALSFPSSLRASSLRSRATAAPPAETLSDDGIPDAPPEGEGTGIPLPSSIGDDGEQMSRPSIIAKLILGLLWGIIHLSISFFNLWSHLIYNLEWYLISSGWLRKYRNLHLSRLKHLAIVVDSKEAKNTAKIKQLLCWLSTVGVKDVCLYDIEGVLKKSFEPAMNGSRQRNAGEYLDVGANIKDLQCSHREMVIECLSGSDGKEGIAKAANLLCSTYLNGDTHGNGKKETVFTEADMASALKAVGCGGPEPDLLLVYGPARCHLGFPAWRLRYTEIMHMGRLQSMKYGAVVKALYNFSKKYQNYGK